MIEVGGTEYPMYRTMMGLHLHEEGAPEDLNTEIKKVCYSAYCLVKGACARESIEFPFTFDEFFIKADPELMEKFVTISPVPAEETEEKKPKAGRSH